MIISPLQNTATLLGGQWLQMRPYVTQVFGVNPQIYKQFGLEGHNGVDFRAAVGTQVFSPMEGIIKVKNDGEKTGYGLYVEIVKDNLKVVLGHLSSVQVENGQKVFLGQKIALTGNSGFSTGPHLHMTVKNLDENGNTKNWDNGYKGAIDFLDLLITYKGTYTMPSI